MEDVWSTTELQVLHAIVELAEHTTWINAADIDRKTGLDPATVDQALENLKYADPEVFRDTSGYLGRTIAAVSGITDYARQLAKQHGD